MTIIAYTYHGPTNLGDNDNVFQNYPTTTPAWLPTIKTDSYFTENFYYKKFNGTSLAFTSATPVGALGLIDYTQNPDNKEFWLRYLWKSFSTTVFYYSQVLCTFYNYNGTRYKKTIDLIIDTDYLFKLRYYTLTEGVDTVESTKTISTTEPHTLLGKDDTTKNIIADIRLSIDAVSGYVQIYGTGGTKVAEYLGQTVTATPLQATHIAVNIQKTYDNPDYIGRNYPVFAIAADEPTFNMYVTPMTVKAEGTLQDQVAGNYTNLTTRKSNPSVSSSVTLTASLGEEKKYSCVLNNMTDIALPANYAVKSFKLSTVVTGESSKQENIPINLLIKKPSTSAIEAKPCGSIIPNQYTEEVGLYQVKEAVFNQNPFTSQPWQPADFADIEVGISFTGN